MRRARPTQSDLGGDPLTDIELFARLIQCEAGGEGDIGMKAVASVVMNRLLVDWGEYGRLVSSLPEVIYQAGQFDCARTTLYGQYNPQNIYNATPDQIHYDIAYWALAGNRVPGLGDALWYFNPYSETCPVNFPSGVGIFVARIGEHCFYEPTQQYAYT